MIENARSLNFAASAILAVGIVFILGPLYLTLANASQSYEFLLRNGLAWYPGDQFVANVMRVFAETRIPVQMLNSMLVALYDAFFTCALWEDSSARCWGSSPTGTTSNSESKDPTPRPLLW